MPLVLFRLAEGGILAKGALSPFPWNLAGPLFTTFNQLDVCFSNHRTNCTGAFVLKLLQALALLQVLILIARCPCCLNGFLCQSHNDPTDLAILQKRANNMRMNALRSLQLTCCVSLTDQD